MHDFEAGLTATVSHSAKEKAMSRADVCFEDCMWRKVQTWEE